MSAIRQWAAANGHALVGEVEEIASGASLKRRGWLNVQRAIRDGQADGVIVSRLDRMSRSVHDASKIFQQAQKEGFVVVMLDPMVDTSTPYGLAFAQVAAVFAQLERDLISQRTREALAEKRRQGIVGGRPTELPPEFDERVYLDRTEGGLSFHAIARQLDEEGLRPPRGGAQWNKNTVERAYRRHLRRLGSSAHFT